MIEHDELDSGTNLETFHVYRMGDGILIRKEEEYSGLEPEIVDSDSLAPVGARVSKSSDNHTAVLIFVCSLIMALLVIVAPNTPITQQVTLVHAFAIGRDVQSFSLAPVTRSESKTVTTTGIGHTAATFARGYLTLYNGSFTSQDIPQNMIFTASNGVKIITDETVTIPAGQPPNYGVATVSSHALNAGMSGNIGAYEINQQCCFSAIKAVNEGAFSGGKDARVYHVVTQQDIKTGVTLLQPLYSLTGDAVLIHGSCSAKIRANHHTGEEANSVKVSTFETCLGSAYSRTSLQERARKLVHIPRDFRLDRLSVNVMQTTPDSITVSIQCNMSYSFAQKEIGAK